MNFKEEKSYNLYTHNPALAGIYSYFYMKWTEYDEYLDK